MKRYLAALLAVLGVVGVLGVLAIGRGFADEEKAAVAKCSKATLHGTYLIPQNGVIVKQKKAGPPRVPFASAGYEVYDGNGHIKSVSSFNFNGNVLRNGHFSGTYTVKANCTGTTTYKSGGMLFQTDMFIAPDGSKFTFIHTKPPEQVVAGFEVRVTEKRVAQ